MPKVAVAIDLGSYAVKALQVRLEKKLFVERSVEVPNTVGLSNPTDDIVAAKLVQLVNNIFIDHKLAKTDVRLALPESLVSTKIISIPVLSDAELASAINWQAEQYIPIPLEELSLEYQVLYRPDRKNANEQMQVLMVGTRKAVVEKYVDIFLQAGIEPTVLETQTIALVRSLQFTADDIPTLVVNLGASSTDMAIVYQGSLRFVYTFPSGAQVLTRTTEQAVQLDAKQAEEYKRSYGLDPTQLAGKMRDILLPPVKNMILEMQKATQFFASQNTLEPLKRVLLAGGGSQLPGLSQLIAEQLNCEVLTAAPFVDVAGDVPKINQPAFGVAMGLLLKPMK